MFYLKIQHGSYTRVMIQTSQAKITFFYVVWPVELKDVNMSGSLIAFKQLVICYKVNYLIP